MSGKCTAVLEGITVFRRTDEGERSRNHFPGTVGVRALCDLERTTVTQKEKWTWVQLREPNSREIVE